MRSRHFGQRFPYKDALRPCRVCLAAFELATRLPPVMIGRDLLRKIKYRKIELTNTLRYGLDCADGLGLNPAIEYHLLAHSTRYRSPGISLSLVSARIEILLKID